jgi:hypothetical protein
MPQAAVAGGTGRPDAKDAACMMFMTIHAYNDERVAAAVLQAAAAVGSIAELF